MHGDFPDGKDAVVGCAVGAQESVFEQGDCAISIEVCGGIFGKFGGVASGRCSIDIDAGAPVEGIAVIGIPGRAEEDQAEAITVGALGPRGFVVVCDTPLSPPPLRSKGGFKALPPKANS